MSLGDWGVEGWTVSKNEFARLAQDGRAESMACLVVNHLDFHSFHTFQLITNLSGELSSNASAAVNSGASVEALCS